MTVRQCDHEAGSKRTRTGMVKRTTVRRIRRRRGAAIAAVCALVASPIAMATAGLDAGPASAAPATGAAAVAGTIAAGSARGVPSTETPLLRRLIRRVDDLTYPGGTTVSPHRPTAHSTPISQVLLESGAPGPTPPTVQTITSGIGVTYSQTTNTLVGSWSGGSVTLAGVGPVTVGGAYLQSGIQISTNANCNAAGAIVVVVVDQLALDLSGSVRAAAFKFGCITLAGDYIIAGTLAFNAVPTTPGQGYYLYESNGLLSPFGNDGFLTYLGDLSALPLNQPVVGMATTKTDAGYWMVAGDGGVFSFGDAGYYGSTGNIALNKPIVGMAASPQGNGYWFVASDGGVFSYGDAGFFGSTGALTLNKPIVGMATTPDGNGYWLVASDGGIFSFGDAGYFGSTGALTLNKPIVGMATTPDGKGYWLVASDGGVFAFGDAGFSGSTGGITLNSPIVGLMPTPDGNGYWFVASDGGVFSFGDASFAGSLGSQGINDVAGITK